MSIDAWAQEAILLSCGLGVVVVNCLGRFVFGQSSPYKGDSARFFVSSVGLLDIHDYSAG